MGLALTYFFIYVVRQGVTSWFVFYLLQVGWFTVAGGGGRGGEVWVCACDLWRCVCACVCVASAAIALQGLACSGWGPWRAAQALPLLYLLSACRSLTLPCRPTLPQVKGVADAGAASLRVSGLELGGLFGSLLAGKLSDMLINNSQGSGGNVGKRVQARAAARGGPAAAAVCTNGRASTNLFGEAARRVLVPMGPARLASGWRGWSRGHGQCRGRPAAAPTLPKLKISLFLTCLPALPPRLPARPAPARSCRWSSPTRWASPPCLWPLPRCPPPWAPCSGPPSS